VTTEIGIELLGSLLALSADLPLLHSSAADSYFATFRRNKPQDDPRVS
jgi:hypothetical protein